jgi:hypothetical protein
MTLRVLLVGLVASMGYELPSGQDIESWTRTGSQWVNARLADLSHLRAEAERSIARSTDSDRAVEPTPAPSATAEVGLTRDDLMFDAVVEGMASDFATDLASIEVAKPVEAVVVAIEPFVEMSEAACLDPELEVAAPDTPARADLEVTAASPAPSPTIEATSKAERISTAIRLTRQAISAWASLIQPSAVRVADHDQIDLF